MVRMIDAFYQTSVCWMSCLKHLGACDVKMFCSNSISHLSQYSGVSDVQVVLQGGNEIVDGEVPIGAAVGIARARLRACQYLPAAGEAVSSGLLRE